jgi:hypothetical protein
MVFSTFAGAFGGIFPNLLKLAMLLTANGEDKLPSYTYLVAGAKFEVSASSGVRMSKVCARPRCQLVSRSHPIALISLPSR